MLVAPEFVESKACNSIFVSVASCSLPKCPRTFVFKCRDKAQIRWNDTKYLLCKIYCQLHHHHCVSYKFNRGKFTMFVVSEMW